MEWKIWPAEWYLDAGVLLVALALDLILPELPARLHPVVWMGKAISLLERLAKGVESRVIAFAWGAFMATVVPVLAGILAWLAASGLRELGPVPYVLGGGFLLATTFAVAGLTRAGAGVRDAMHANDMDGARLGLRHLVSRDPSALTPHLVAAAAIESVAENTTDSYIAPWLAFALLGIPGAFAYRAVNTLDSMIGYRGRYEYLGKASARLDDVLNLIPARISAVLILVSGRLHGYPATRGWTWAWRGRLLTESPNAGWTIGGMAGVLGVVLEKTSYYRIGDGLRDPAATDVGAAVRIAYTVAGLGAVTTLSLLVVRSLLGG